MSFRADSAETVLLAQSLCLARYSSLNWVSVVEEGMRVNSDLIISAALGGSSAKSLSRASLNLMVCRWTSE